MNDIMRQKNFKNIESQELRNLHYSMFEYKNLPETVDPLYIETFLQEQPLDQFCGWWRLTEREASPGFPAGSLIVSSATLGTDLNPYGEGAEVICVTRNGHEKRFRNRYEDEVVVGFNNLLKEPCIDIETDAETLGAIDLSLQYLIFYTRLYPLYKVTDEKARDKVLTAFRNMDLGKPLTIIDKPLLEELGIDSKTIDQELLTSPDMSRLIQFTGKLKEDVKRWHYTKYGQTINATTKMAQETVDEVNSSVSSSLILPLSMLEARRRMIDEVNAKFGTNIEVDFSGAWRAEVTRYEDISGEDEIDGTEEPEEPETPEESEVENNDEIENKRDSEESDNNESV